MISNALTLPPREGWNWLLYGWQLFRKNPRAALILASTYFGIVIFLSVLIPFIGSIFTLILLPGLTASTMLSCRMIIHNQIITPSCSVHAFFIENKRFSKPLLKLGLSYCVVVLICSIAVSQFISFDLSLLQKNNQEMKSEVAIDFFIKLLLLALAYIPVMMSFWFAPVLVLWHEMPPTKAIFFSFIASWRNRLCFLTYALNCFFWLILTSLCFGLLIAVLPMPSFLIFTFNFAIAIVFSAVLQCSFLPSYLSIFEHEIFETIFKNNPLHKT